MGLLSRFNRKQKTQRQTELNEFQTEVAKLSQRYGFRIRAIISTYGPQIEIVDVGKVSAPRVETQQNASQ